MQRSGVRPFARLSVCLSHQLTAAVAHAGSPAGRRYRSTQRVPGGGVQQQRRHSTGSQQQMRTVSRLKRPQKAEHRVVSFCESNFKDTIDSTLKTNRKKK